MADAREADGALLVELRAWQVRGGEQKLVGERVRGPDGSRRVIWHVPEAELRGILWIEHLIWDGPSWR